MPQTDRCDNWCDNSKKKSEIEELKHITVVEKKIVNEISQ